VIGSSVRYRSTSRHTSSLHRTIDAVWRIESARVIAGLTRLNHMLNLPK
jgi:hypothetical protein